MPLSASTQSELLAVRSSCSAPIVTKLYDTTSAGRIGFTKIRKTYAHNLKNRSTLAFLSRQLPQLSGSLLLQKVPLDSTYSGWLENLADSPRLSPRHAKNMHDERLGRDRTSVGTGLCWGNHECRQKESTEAVISPPAVFKSHRILVGQVGLFGNPCPKVESPTNNPEKNNPNYRCIFTLRNLLDHRQSHSTKIASRLFLIVPLPFPEKT
ncbi:hypothetical protein AFLA_004564 [Aspergillus flavus NRRL3357]|nr:hypothetical protein AFLA_004564 [Aspergillus flavus NRRL3357]